MVWYASGRRGESSLRFRGLEIGAAWTGFTDRPAFSDARAIADGLAAAYVDDKVDRVEIIYNGFISAVRQEVRHETLLPLQQADILEDEGEESDSDERGRGASRSSTGGRCGSTSRTPRRSSPGWCPTTSRSRSTGRCSSRRRPSTARA